MAPPHSLPPPLPPLPGPRTLQAPEGVLGEIGTEEEEDAEEDEEGEEARAKEEVTWEDVKKRRGPRTMPGGALCIQRPMRGG